MILLFNNNKKEQRTLLNGPDAVLIMQEIPAMRVESHLQN